MQLRRLFLFVFALFFISHIISAEPTAEREWTSSVGSTLTAKAISYEDGKVQLVSTEGKTFTLLLEKLSAADQTFIKEHFKPAPPKVEAYAPPEIDHPLGKAIGPLDTGKGSTYYIYFPKSMAADSKAPLLFYTSPVLGKASVLAKYSQAADLTGMAIACSVESRNSDHGGGTFAENSQHVERCLEHIAATFPIDTKRVFFAGFSGGAATAFLNSERLQGLGVLGIGGYIPNGTQPPKKGFYATVSGGGDFNLLHCARIAKSYGDRAMHRVTPGRHVIPSKEICSEVAIWLYCRHIFENQKKHSLERKRFEARFYDWLTTMQKKEPTIACFWTDQLLTTNELSGDFKAAVQSLHDELITDSENARYVKNYQTLLELSKNVVSTGDMSKIARESEKILPDFKGQESLHTSVRTLIKYANEQK